MKKSKKINWAFLVLTGICIILVLAKPTIAQEERAITITRVGYSWTKCPTPYYINWTSTGSIESVKIDILEENVWVYTIVQETANNGYYSWDFADDEEFTANNIRVSDTSNPNINDTFYFQYDTSITICQTIDSYSSVLIIMAIGITIIPVIIKLKMKKKVLNYYLTKK